MTVPCRTAWLIGRNQGEDIWRAKPVAIVFDTFGTVVDWRGSLIAELTAFGRERGISADWTALVDAWRAAYHPSMDRVRKGEQPWTTLDNLHRASLDKLVARVRHQGPDAKPICGTSTWAGIA